MAERQGDLSQDKKKSENHNAVLHKTLSWPICRTLPWEGMSCHGQGWVTASASSSRMRQLEYMVYIYVDICRQCVKSGLEPLAFLSCQRDDGWQSEEELGVNIIGCIKYNDGCIPSGACPCVLCEHKSRGKSVVCYHQAHTDSYGRKMCWRLSGTEISHTEKQFQRKWLLCLATRFSVQRELPSNPPNWRLMIRYS